MKLGPSQELNLFLLLILYTKVCSNHAIRCESVNNLIQMICCTCCAVKWEDIKCQALYIYTTRGYPLISLVRKEGNVSKPKLSFAPGHFKHLVSGLAPDEILTMCIYTCRQMYLWPEEICLHMCSYANQPFTFKHQLHHCSSLLVS